MEPKKRQITVVTEAITVLFMSALWNVESPKIWAYSAVVGVWGMMVGGVA
jgi:hypothetical protein